MYLTIMMVKFGFIKIAFLLLKIILVMTGMKLLCALMNLEIVFLVLVLLVV